MLFLYPFFSKNMKKYPLHLFFLFASLTIGASLSANPVDTATLLRVAVNFYQYKAPESVSSIQPQKVYTWPYQSSNSRNETPAFYIYNMGSSYVIIAADNRINPILGYSTESPFDPENLSPAMADIFSDYADEIASVLQSPEALPNPLWQQLIQNQAINTRNEVMVPPLLTSLWNQNSYYNSLCPVDSSGPGNHVYAGCVATAMAQAMRYWRYPAQGIGSYSYTCDYGTLSADFGNTTYNYALMPDKLTASTPSAQLQEVAKLIYHCGVAVDMDYGYDGSGAYLSQSPSAFAQYFGYTSPTTYISKSHYTTANWINTIKGQLDALRPVLYRGHSDEGGHAFVCDGYDNLNYFHFNWGWGGSNNGYFQLSALTPGTHDFNTSQGAVINLYVERPMMKVSRQNMTLYSLNGSADTAQVRVIAVSGGQNVTASVSGNFTISDGSAPFANTLTLNNGNHLIYVRYQETTSTTQTQYGTLTLTYDSLTVTVSLTGEAIPIQHAAPQSLTAAYTSPYVHLTWSSPSPVIRTYNHGETTHSSNYGYSSDYSRTILQRLCDTDLVAYYPAQLTHISFYLRSAVTTCKLVVYQGGSYENQTLIPGDMVIEQPLNISQLNTSAWNTVALTTPVPIVLGEEIWYGIYLEAPGGSYTMPVGNTGNYVPEKGDVVCRHYASGSNSWSFFNVGRNFSVRAQFQTLPPTLSHYRVARDSTLIGATLNTHYDDQVTTSGVYSYQVAAIYTDGAAADVSTNITVNVINIFDTTEASICSDENYLFHGQTLTQSGTYQHYENDTLFVVQLTVHEYPALTLTASSTNLQYPETATLTASGADNYQWSTGETTNQIVVCPTVPTTYAVTASLEGSPCESVDSVMIFTQGYGVEEFESQKVLCYPNPVNATLYVQAPNCDRLTLVDATGQVVKRWYENNEQWQLPMDNCPDGFYLLIGEKGNMRVFATRVVVGR